MFRWAVVFHFRHLQKTHVIHIVTLHNIKKCPLFIGNEFTRNYIFALAHFLKIPTYWVFPLIILFGREYVESILCRRQN